jgi:DNA-binding NtrC family response regulator
LLRWGVAMPAQVVIVHEDDAFRSKSAAAVAGQGYSVTAFHDALDAMHALEDARELQVLVTSLHFAEGRSNGFALAGMAKSRKRDSQVIFILETQMDAALVSDEVVLYAPVSLSDLVTAIRDCLGSSRS